VKSALPLLFALLAPSLGAQGLLPANPGLAGDGDASLQLEAVWLLTPEDRSASPLERLVSPGSLPSQRAGLRTTAAGPSLGASLSLERGTPAMALLCRSGAPLVSLGSMAEHCLLAEIDAPADLMGGLMRSTRAELNWHSPSAGLDLSFGLFWLRPESAFPSYGPGLAAPATSWDFALSAPELRGISLGASKSFFVGDELKLILGGAFAHQELRLAGLGPVQEGSLLDLSLTLESGAFSGVLSRRQYLPDVGGQRWQAVDLGLAWRTPWHGQLSLGARNLLGKPSPHSLTPTQALGFTSETDLLDEPSQGRVPFVRYRQDL